VNQTPPPGPSDRPAADWFTGERDAQITDPFGHRWGLTQHVRDVPRDEIERAAIAVSQTPAREFRRAPPSRRGPARSGISTVALSGAATGSRVRLNAGGR
jgi:hypothetical protein